MVINVAILAASLILPTAVQAQGQNPTNPPANTDVQQARQDIRKDRQEIRKDVKEIQDLNAQRSDAVKDLAAKEKAEMEAVKTDASLTAEQKKAKAQGIRKSYRDQRREAGRKLHEEKRQLKGDIHKERQEIRGERQKLREERRERHHDAQQKH